MKDRITIYDMIRNTNFNVLVDDISIVWITDRVEATYISFGVREQNGKQLYIEKYEYPQDLEIRIRELEEYFGDLVGVFRPREGEDNDK